MSGMSAAQIPPSMENKQSAAASKAGTGAHVVVDMPPSSKLTLTATVSFVSQHWFFLLSTAILSATIVFTNFSRRPGTSYLGDLENGMPVRGQLGLGRFEIYGVTVPFEYPFRLAVRNIPASVTPWICYLLHQAGQFWIIFQAREAKASGKLDWTPAGQWNPYALAMLKLNVGFILLHYVQTQLFYDGLAATFTEIGTLFAGVSSILVAFIFEFRRRGLVFGWTPVAGQDLLFEFTDIVKSYHGYLSSFGMVLTFWYHCMESTFAHWTGFIHIFLLLWQSSLIYQKQHRNRYWTLVLEMWILLHGSVVAYYQGILEGALHLMFMTSFTLLFLMGPLWGLPFVRDYLTGGNQSLRRQVLLYSSLAWFAYFAISKFAANGSLQWSFLVIALPMLYYVFALWYFGFFLLGKKIDAAVVEAGLIVRNSKAWWILMYAWGFLSIASIMFLGEFVYRIFVPYGMKIHG